MANGFGPYFTLDELIGRPVTIPDFLQLLSKIPRDDAVRWISGISAVLERVDARELGAQVALLENLVPAGLWQEVTRALETNTHPGVFLHRRQLWLLLQMALITCKDDAPPIPEDELKLIFGECLLMANDVLKKVELAIEIDIQIANSLPFLITALISYSDTNFGSEVFARARLLWLEIPELSTIQAKAAELQMSSFDQLFIETYGVPIREFLLFATVIYHRFVEAIIHYPPRPAVYHSNAAFKGYFSGDHLENCLLLLSAWPDDLAASLLGKARQSWANDFTPLMKSPLIRRADFQFVCADLHMFRSFFMQGIFDLLIKADQTRNFKQLFGFIFEEYINQLMRSFAPPSPVLVNTFYSPVYFIGENKEACDSLLLWNSIAVLFECKAGILTARQRYAMSIDETTKAIDDQLAKFDSSRKGIGQLAHNIVRILKGDRIHSGDTTIDLSQVPKLYPAIILYDDSIANHAVRIHLQNKMDEWLQAQSIDTSRIGKVLIFTMRDIEYFESYAHAYGAEKLMQEYIQFVENNPLELRSMFHEYAIKRFPTPTSSTSNTLATVDRVLADVMAEMNQRKANLPQT